MSSTEIVAIIIYNLPAIVLTRPSQGFALHRIRHCKNMQQKASKQYLFESIQNISLKKKNKK